MATSDSSLQKSGLRKHIEIWAEPDRETITEGSIIRAHHVRGIRDGVEFKARAIMAMFARAGFTGSECTVTNLVKIGVRSPNTTCIWNTRGNIDEAEFVDLMTMGDGKLITRAMVAEHLREKNQHRSRCHIACWVRPTSWSGPIKVPLMCTAVTNASFDDLFRYFADTKDADGNPAFTVARFREFYTDSSKAMCMARGTTQASAKP